MDDRIKGTIEEFHRCTARLCFEWRVEGFLPLTPLDCLCSPDISFDDASWHMYLLPNAEWLDLCLCRRDAFSSETRKIAVSVIGSRGEDHRKEWKGDFPTLSAEWRVWDDDSAPKMADLRSGLLQEDGALVLRCEIETEAGGPAMVPQYNGMPPRGMFPTPGMVQGSQGPNPNTQQQLLRGGGARPMTPQGPGAMAQGGGAMPQGWRGPAVRFPQYNRTPPRGMFPMPGMVQGSQGQNPNMQQQLLRCGGARPMTPQGPGAMAQGGGAMPQGISDDATTLAESQSSVKEAMEELQSSLRRLYESGEGCDVVVKVQGKEFPAHKCILLSRSPVFQAMFSHDMLERAQNTINIEDLDQDTFPSFLEHIYTGSLAMISASNVFFLFTAADKYDLRALKKGCSQFMGTNMTVTSFCDVVRMAVKHSATELMEHATEFFCSNSLVIVETPEWQTFLEENLTVGNGLVIKAFSKYNGGTN